MESQDLRKAGLKVTHPRMRILELLEQAKPRHMTAEDIYKRLINDGEEIGLATIYRVLTQFEAAGLVLKHNFEGGHAVYELDRGEHHDHMVDVDSGKVIEFHSDEIEALLTAAGLEIVEPECGELVTSLDMSGLSLTLFWLDEELEQFWSAPADTPAFRKGNLAPRRARSVAVQAGAGTVTSFTAT